MVYICQVAGFIYVHDLYMSSSWISLRYQHGETKEGGSQFKTSLGYIVTSDNLASQQ